MSNAANIPEEMLSAYLDGELTADERQQVEVGLEQSAELRSTLEELQQIRSELKALPRFSLSPDFTERVLQSFEAQTEPPKSEPAKSEQSNDSTKRSDPRRKWMAGLLAMAATILFAFWAIDQGGNGSGVAILKSPAPASDLKTDMSARADVDLASVESDGIASDGIVSDDTIERSAALNLAQGVNGAAEDLLRANDSAFSAPGSMGGGMGGGMGGRGFGNQASDGDVEAFIANDPGAEVVSDAPAPEAITESITDTPAQQIMRQPTPARFRSQTLFYNESADAITAENAPDAGIVAATKSANGNGADWFSWSKDKASLQATFRFSLAANDIASVRNVKANAPPALAWQEVQVPGQRSSDPDIGQDRYYLQLLDPNDGFMDVHAANDAQLIVVEGSEEQILQYAKQFSGVAVENPVVTQVAKDPQLDELSRRIAGTSSFVREEQMLAKNGNRFGQPVAQENRSKESGERLVEVEAMADKFVGRSLDARNLGEGQLGEGQAGGVQSEYFRDSAKLGTSAATPNSGIASAAAMPPSRSLSMRRAVVAPGTPVNRGLERLDSTTQLGKPTLGVPKANEPQQNQTQAAERRFRVLFILEERD